VFPDRLSEFLEILLIFLIVLPLLKFLRGVISGNVLRMLAFVLAVIAIGAMILLQRFRLEALDLVFKGALVLAVFTLLMVFQPELRRG
jgi:DNA integrity scanning protein DisA with diadenylate cyclase activity